VHVDVADLEVAEPERVDVQVGIELLGDANLGRRRGRAGRILELDLIRQRLPGPMTETSWPIAAASWLSWPRSSGLIALEPALEPNRLSTAAWAEGASALVAPKPRNGT